MRPVGGHHAQTYHQVSGGSVDPDLVSAGWRHVRSAGAGARHRSAPRAGLKDAGKRTRWHDLLSWLRRPAPVGVWPRGDAMAAAEEAMAPSFRRCFLRLIGAVDAHGTCAVVDHVEKAARDRQVLVEVQHVVGVCNWQVYPEGSA